MSQDQMFRFWYEFVPKATSVIEMGQGGLQLRHYMGGIFEEMCRYYALEQGILGKFGNFITKTGSWWGTETVVLGECKFKNEKIEKEIYETLLRRSRVISGKYRIVKYVLFSLSGYTSWFDELEDENLLKLTLEDLYQD